MNIRCKLIRFLGGKTKEEYDKVYNSLTHKYMVVDKDNADLSKLVDKLNKEVSMLSSELNSKQKIQLENGRNYEDISPKKIPRW